MWLFTTEGFLSIAQKGANADVLTVRSRAKSDLIRFLTLHVVPQRVEVPKIVEGGGTDYPFRVELPREIVAAALVSAAVAVDYPNFKDALTRRLGNRYHDVASSIWRALLALEPPGFWDKQRALLSPPIAPPSPRKGWRRLGR